MLFPVNSVASAVDPRPLHTVTLARSVYKRGHPLLRSAAFAVRVADPRLLGVALYSFTAAKNPLAPK
jgi:hypothetical protein